MICFFPLSPPTFKIFSLSVLFNNLLIICLDLIIFVDFFSVWNSLSFLNLGSYIFFLKFAIAMDIRTQYLLQFSDNMSFSNHFPFCTLFWIV